MVFAKDSILKPAIFAKNSQVILTLITVFLSCFLSNICNCDAQNNSTSLTKRLKERNLTTHLTCLSTCRMQDADLDLCWRKSLEYHSQELAQQLERFASVLLHINYWREVNGFKPSEFVGDMKALKTVSSFEVSTIEEVTAKLGRPEETEIEERNPALSGTEIKNLLLQIFNMTVDMRSRYNEMLETSEHLPRLSCPTPCQYYPGLWVALFMVTLSVLILFIITLVLYTVYTSHWRRSPSAAASQSLLSAGDGRSAIS